MIRRWHAAGAAIILAMHLLGHFASEAIHELIVEVSISPLMHLTEHSVAKAMDAEPAKAPNFHAHHHLEAR